MEDIDKGWGYCLGACSKVSTNGKCPKKKNHTLTLKIISWGRKSIFFLFLSLEIKIWLQNQIKCIISCIKPTFFVWIRHIWENKNFTSSGRHHCISVYFRFFEHFRLADTFETPPRQWPQPLAMFSKRVWVDISNSLEGVRLKKSDAFKKKPVI